VPALWTRKRAIVNNESADHPHAEQRLRRMRRKLHDLYPEKLRREIDWLNERIYRTVNNGVYRAGFATAQDKYEEAVTELFRTLDW
jgi:putative glutathione S-transferase